MEIHKDKVGNECKWRDKCLNGIQAFGRTFVIICNNLCDANHDKSKHITSG